MASVLFLAPADLGEAVLATGAVAHAAREGADVLVVCTPEAAPLFVAPPHTKLRLTPTEWGPLTGLGLWFELVQQRFDLVIDGRGGFPGNALPTARRVTLKPAAMLRHRSEDWAAALDAERMLAPKLWIADYARAAAAAVAPEGAVLALAPGGARASKRWPAERFAAVARRLATGPLSGATIVVLGAAARDAALTRAIVASLDADGVAALDLGQGLDLAGAAALLERATLCIGNDNALTHIAAAMGAPTLALFGPTDERVRAPSGPRVRTLRGRSFAELAAGAALDDARAMDDVSIDAVEAAALQLLHAGGL